MRDNGINYNLMIKNIRNAIALTGKLEQSTILESGDMHLTY